MRSPSATVAAGAKKSARRVAIAAVAATSIIGCSRPGSSPEATLALESCRLKGVEIAVRCATLQVPEDRERADDPAARRIPIRIAVVPALARRPEPDAIFVLAGGPGQAATDVAGSILPLFSKLNRNRDLVFVDQRGTGGSNKLSCATETAARPETMADAFDNAAFAARLDRCAERLAGTADLTRYTTPIAMQDLDEVRQRLGYRQVDLWGASYGTRAALEYLRQFPEHVRTLTLDGVAPTSQKLPLSFGVDTYAAVVGLVTACRADAACAARYPRLGADVDALLAKLDAAALPTEVTNPLTGRRERAALTLPGFASLLRTPLYVGLTASVLPSAVDKAARGDFDGLAALAYTVGSGLEDQIALGMHLAVVCSEDVPTITDDEVAAARAERTSSRLDGRPNRFATIYLDQYRRWCRAWPTARLPAGYAASLAGRPGADVPTLLLSGGIDPATPPAYADRVAKTLTKARHVIAPNVGHGVSLQGCAPDLIERFVKSADAAALDTDCLVAIPRPPFAAPVVAARGDDDKTVAPLP